METHVLVLVVWAVLTAVSLRFKSRGFFFGGMVTLLVLVVLHSLIVVGLLHWPFVWLAI